MSDDDTPDESEVPSEVVATLLLPVSVRALGPITEALIEAYGEDLYARFPTDTTMEFTRPVSDG